MPTTKRPERKTISLQLEYPINWEEERIDMIREEAASKLADVIRQEILKEIGPNWFLCNDGWRTGRDRIHQPGIYKFRVDFMLENTLEHSFARPTEV